MKQEIVQYNDVPIFTAILFAEFLNKEFKVPVHSNAELQWCLRNFPHTTTVYDNGKKTKHTFHLEKYKP